jgi:hypothetical protein
MDTRIPLRNNRKSSRLQDAVRDHAVMARTTKNESGVTAKPILRWYLVAAEMLALGIT